MKRISSFFSSLALLSGLFSAGFATDLDSESGFSRSQRLFSEKLAQRIPQPRQSASSIVSPMSLSAALSMTMLGMNGNTRDQTAAALELTEPQLSYHQSFSEFLKTVETTRDTDGDGEPEFQMRSANRVFVERQFRLQPSFVTALDSLYGAAAASVDARQPQAAADQVNQWVADETAGRITQLVDADQMAAADITLVNAVYFKGAWQHPFARMRTREQPFTSRSGEMRKAQMMQFGKPCEDLSVTLSGDGETMVLLPYADPDYAMAVRAPAPGLLEVSAFDAESFAEDVQNGQQLCVKLEMPKFEFGSTWNLESPLKSMGVIDAFVPGLADFSAMTPDPEGLAITKVIQKANVTVDEWGTEAAAATAISVGRTSAPVDPEPDLTLVLDRPFDFVILHRPTLTPLFMGNVNF